MRFSTEQKLIALHRCFRASPTPTLRPEQGQLGRTLKTQTSGSSRLADGPGEIVQRSKALAHGQPRLDSQHSIMVPKPCQKRFPSTVRSKPSALLGVAQKSKPKQSKQKPQDLLPSLVRDRADFESGLTPLSSMWNYLLQFMNEEVASLRGGWDHNYRKTSQIIQH